MKYDLIRFIAIVITCVICIFILRWWFNTVMAADIPNWMKYMILR